MTSTDEECSTSRAGAAGHRLTCNGALHPWSEAEGDTVQYVRWTATVARTALRGRLPERHAARVDTFR